MGEAIMTRKTPLTDEMKYPITVPPGYHAVLVKLTTVDGVAITNHPINCLDGSHSYNYKTNEAGMCLFTVNSGSANIFCSNNIGGIIYSDINDTWMNVQAPIGQSTRLNFKYNNATTKTFFSNCSVYIFRGSVNCNVQLVGGGGGGGAHDGSHRIFSGGGAGYLNYGISKVSNNSQLVIGRGGAPNYTGGTSTFIGYSANGGTGGSYESPGIGGLGNGWNCQSGSASGTASSVTFAGGGGGYGIADRSWSTAYNVKTGPAGSPYGGRGAGVGWNGLSDTGKKVKAQNGSNGGGGGGAAHDRVSGVNYSAGAGWGGNGLLKLDFLD